MKILFVCEFKMGVYVFLIFVLGFKRIVSGLCISRDLSYPNLHSVDYLCFHAPFTRLVQKAYGWLALMDVKEALLGDISNSRNCGAPGDEDEGQASDEIESLDKGKISIDLSVLDSNNQNSVDQVDGAVFEALQDLCLSKDFELVLFLGIIH